MEKAQKAAVVTGNGVLGNTSFKSIVLHLHPLSRSLSFIEPSYMYQKQSQYD